MLSENSGGTIINLFIKGGPKVVPEKNKEQAHSFPYQALRFVNCRRTIIRTNVAVPESARDKRPNSGNGETNKYGEYIGNDEGLVCVLLFRGSVVLYDFLYAGNTNEQLTTITGSGLRESTSREFPCGTRGLFQYLVQRGQSTSL